MWGADVEEVSVGERRLGILRTLASPVGVGNAFRTMRLPGPAPSTAVEGMLG